MMHDIIQTKFLSVVEHVLRAKDDSQGCEYCCGDDGEGGCAGRVAAITVTLAVSNSNPLGTCPVYAFVHSIDGTATHYTFVTLHILMHLAAHGVVQSILLSIFGIAVYQFQLTLVYWVSTWLAFIPLVGVALITLDAVGSLNANDHNKGQNRQ